MKIKTTLLLFFSALVFFACQKESSENDYKINLELESFDYFEKEIPFGNLSYGLKANHDEIAALGRLLFYDSRMSQNNSVACASCHKQELGFADKGAFSTGVKNFQTSRNSMSLVNNGYQKFHFWEGHRGDISETILNPISNHIEMGMKSPAELVEKLLATTEYNRLFKEVYATDMTDSLLANALSTFVTSIISYNSKFDIGKDSEYVNFSLDEKAGKDLFFGKAQCGSCHKGNHLVASWRDQANIGLDLVYEDEGAGSGMFKIPSLRNVAITGPYMHDGRFETLAEVVNHYVNGVKDHPKLDWKLQEPIVLSDKEQEQLVEFLHTFTDYTLISDRKFSNPF